MAAKLRCFMAMAFDREDTDAVFDRFIAPVVKTLTVAGESVGTSPIRADRVEHNDDIDDRIMSELSACDFVIADLTYARPSVYYGAGYAQARVPVVFTCRRDHFRPRADDPDGNRRVHFDLQMRNIVAWRDPRDEPFAEKLRRRLVHVLTPVVRKKAREASEKTAETAFERLSVVDRAATMMRIARKQLSALRVPSANHEKFLDKLSRLYKPPFNRLWHQLSEALTHGGALTAVRRIPAGQAIESWTVVVSATSLTKRQFSAATDLYVNRPGYDLGPWLGREQLASQDHVVFCTPGTVTSAMVAALLPKYRQLSPRSWFVNLQDYAPRPIPPYTTVYAVFEGALQFERGRGEAAEPPSQAGKSSSKESYSTHGIRSTSRDHRLLIPLRSCVRSTCTC